MYTHAQNNSLDIRKLRQSAGVLLKTLRERRGLSQRQLANLVGTEPYTFISQLENGRGRIPPNLYHTWAQVLGVEPRLFVRELMKYYDPVTYGILFGSEIAVCRQLLTTGLADVRSERPGRRGSRGARGAA